MQNIKKVYCKIKAFYLKKSLVKNIDLKKYQIEGELKNHMLRVSKYAELLANLCIEANKIEQIKKGALLHDIGKN